MLSDFNNFKKLDDCEKLLAVCEMLIDTTDICFNEQFELERLRNDKQYQKELKIYAKNLLNDLYQKYTSIKKLYDTIK